MTLSLPEVLLAAQPLLAAGVEVEVREFLHQAQQPYYGETLLWPALSWGLGLSTLLYMAAHFLKDERWRRVFLVLIAACSLAVIPLHSLRKRAERLHEVPRRGSAAVTRLLHEERWFYYGLAAAAAGALCFPSRPRLGPLLGAVTMAGGVALTCFGLWLHARDLGVLHWSPKPRRAAAVRSPAPPGSSASGPAAPERREGIAPAAGRRSTVPAAPTRRLPGG